jgi:hypothetical protein
MSPRLSRRVDLPPLPLWARAADVLTLVLAMLALCVAIGGGVQLHALDVRISMSSVAELLAGAAVCAGLRHWRIPRPSLAVRIRDAVLRQARDPATSTALAVGLATRAAVVAVGLYAVFAFGYQDPVHPFRISDNELLNLPARWDAGWYYQIAAAGYQWDRTSPRQQNIAFFPAYPMLTRFTGQLLGASNEAYFYAGLIVSLAAFLWALDRLHRLARRLVPNVPDVGRATVVLLAAYPFAVFYGNIYTEGLFLLAAVSCFWHAERERWGRVAGWGLLAGLTRPNGIFLCASLAVFALRQAWRTQTPSTRERLRRALWPLCASAAPALGLVIYAAYVHSLTGNFWQWAAIQERWGRSFTGLEGVAEPFTYIARHGFLTYLKDAPADVFNGLAVILMTALLVPITRRLGLAYGLFVAFNLFVPLAKGGLLSTGRISSTLFPAFIWLALRVPASSQSTWVAVFAIGQGLLAALFYTWRSPY